VSQRKTLSENAFFTVKYEEVLENPKQKKNNNNLEKFLAGFITE
jgi:hypothetical protein